MRLEKSDGHTFVVGSGLHERVNILWDVCSVTTGQDGVGERHGNTTMSIRAIHIRIGEFPGTCLAAGSPPVMRSIFSLRRAQDSPNGRPYGHLTGGHPVKALPLPLLKYRTATSAIHHETCQTSGQLSKPA